MPAGTENRERRTENGEPRTENREPRTENREPRTENREPRTLNSRTLNSRTLRLLEIELEPNLQHARRDDLLHAAEVRHGGARCVERRLTRVAAGDRAVADLPRAGIQRVVQLGDERRTARAADPEALVRAQRQQPQ